MRFERAPADAIPESEREESHIRTRLAERARVRHALELRLARRDIARERPRWHRPDRTAHEEAGARMALEISLINQSVIRERDRITRDLEVGRQLSAGRHRLACAELTVLNQCAQ